MLSKALVQAVLRQCSEGFDGPLSVAPAERPVAPHQQPVRACEFGDECEEPEGKP